MTTKRKHDLSKDHSTNVTDEVFNAASHLAGALFALTGLVLLVVYAGVAGKPWHVVSFSIYGVSLVSLFLASALHHGVNASARIERVLWVIDHGAVFLLIAGSFTPVCLVLARGPLGWSVFGVTWFLAVIGIAIKSARPDIPSWVTSTIYVTMGWMAVLLAIPLMRTLHFDGTALFAVGGIAYSIGVVIYTLEKPNPVPGKFGFHEIWHICVLIAALCHYAVMYFYILPY